MKACEVAGVNLDERGPGNLNRILIGLGPDVLDRVQAAARRVEEERDPTFVFDLSSLTPAPPIADPGKVICVGANYRDHIRESGIPTPEYPVLFAKFGNSLVGATDEIVVPKASQKVDWEGELAVIIGRETKEATVETAIESVGGYMVFNDVSARDLQTQTSQWLAGKAIDTFAPCGPHLVTADEVDDPQRLQIETRLNGTVMQRESTSEMLFPVAEIIAYISRGMTLDPGDIIATGTPAGVGLGRDPAIYMSPGDVIEVEIEGLGRLANRVVASDAGSSVAGPGLTV